LLLPQDPNECFEFGATSFDLAERLQSPVFVMLDLDIGMNERLCEPFDWDDKRQYDQGKLMTHELLEAGKEFGRYLDVDGDGIPWRTIPGTHPTKGAFFTRGTTRNPYAKYSETGGDYVYNMERLRRKFNTARSLVPAPEIRNAAKPTRQGVIYFGSTAPAMDEALTALAAQGQHLNAMRLKAFPFPDSVLEFIERHDRVFIVEQNEMGQMRSLLINELELNPEKLFKLVHYDGTPITARFIVEKISGELAGIAKAPLKKVMS
jgi:2-oxoglutarate ferredoxin oxidoreductase subunit alpha